MEKGLTIVVPVRNREHIVVRTLDGIAGGKCQPNRLIIVDNGSTDSSLRVCQEWAEAHSCGGMDVKVIEEPRSGAAMARNRGLGEVQTEWVYFFDSDDEFDAAFVEDVMNKLSSATGYDIAFIPVCQEIRGCLAERAYTKPLKVEGQVLSSMLATQNVVYRTEWLRRLGGWNENLTTWDDWELGVRVAKAAPRVLWLTERAYHKVFVHADSLTGPTYASRHDAIVRALRAVAADVCDNKSWSRALYLRAQIVAGTLRHEGSNDSSVQAIIKELPENVSLTLRATGWLLKQYVTLGRRGGWRIALKVT